MHHRIKFVLLLGGVGIFYVCVTLLALILGLIAEVGRETLRPYFTATCMAIGLVAIWAALVTVIA